MELDKPEQTAVNNGRTRDDSGAPLTRARSPDVLLVKRNRVGAESREGRLISNLIKQRPWLDDTTGDRSWAKHPTQQMPWMDHERAGRSAGEGEVR